MKKLFVIFVLIFLGKTAIGQMGISGGINMLKDFGTPKPYVGLHFGVEVPRDDENSIYGRVSFYGKQSDDIKNYTVVTAFDPTTIPYSLNVGYKNSMNYTILEGGNRYYIGDGYDSGFGAYGGGTGMVIFNTVKRTYDDYDQAVYSLPDNEIPRGAIVSLALGLNGGFKYTFAGVGSIYGDAGFGYVLFGKPSNTTAQQLFYAKYSGLIFTFNIGFRKELY